MKGGGEDTNYCLVYLCLVLTLITASSYLCFYWFLVKTSVQLAFNYFSLLSVCFCDYLNAFVAFSLYS